MNFVNLYSWIIYSEHFHARIPQSGMLPHFWSFKKLLFNNVQRSFQLFGTHVPACDKSADKNRMTNSDWKKYPEKLDQTIVNQIDFHLFRSCALNH